MTMLSSSYSSFSFLDEAQQNAFPELETDELLLQYLAFPKLFNDFIDLNDLILHKLEFLDRREFYWLKLFPSKSYRIGLELW